MQPHHCAALITCMAHESSDRTLAGLHGRASHLADLDVVVLNVADEILQKEVEHNFQFLLQDAASGRMDGPTRRHENAFAPARRRSRL